MGTTKKSMWAAGLAALILGPGCSQSTGPDVTPDLNLLPEATEVALRYGEDVQVPNSVLRLSFGRVVEDSRCPVNALIQCVWEGNARVEIGIAAGSGPTIPIQLNTALDPRSATWNGVLITLLEVLPVPADVDPIPPEQYSVRLELEPVAR